MVGADCGLPEDWKRGMIAWAAGNDSVAELWLFGSRGPKGGACPDSDVDVGLVLMPAAGDHDWALGNYAALSERWRAELESIVGRHVSLVPMRSGNEGNAIIRSTGVRLWEHEP